jgi:hypothetical protein
LTGALKPVTKDRPFIQDAFARKQKEVMAKQKAPNARRAIVEE